MLTSTLTADLKAAYDRLTADMRRIARNSQGGACFPGSDDEVQALLHQAAARCGAFIGAAVKREKRRLLISSLLDAHRGGMDITPAIAQGTARRVLGRGLDSRFTAQHFSRPGRTAADKSTVTPDDLAEFENNLVSQLQPLIEEIEAAKHRANAQWHASAARLEVLADWAQQRREQLQEEFRFAKGFMSNTTA